MDTTFLQTFLLVVDTGSMSEAARRLDLTPAAVAQQLRAIERELGTTLVARAGRTVQPTEAGQRLAGQARILIREFSGLRALVNDEYATGELRIGTINTALHSLLPETLARFVKLYPQVKVFIMSAHSHELYEAVRQGDLDAAVCLHPQFTLPKTIEWEQLREEPLVVLAPPRLAKSHPHTLLREQPLLRYDRRLGGGKQADRYMRKLSITPHERLELSSLLAIAMMVEQGMGVSLVPDIASPLMTSLNVKRLPLPEELEPRRFGILWRRASVRIRLIRVLLDQARRTLST